ncbi:MAG: ABC transporter ATP-binding protein [Planctomycetales bacterium]|nr:ABC transporter ATP-binding protein [Planctomycetales bacterium]
MTTTAIEVDGLRKRYRDGWLVSRQFEALKGISLQVAAGEIFGLLGPNGAGKTTFVKILLGIIRKSEGVAQVFGRRAGNRASRRRIGYLPEHLVIPRHHTGVSALEYYGGLSGLSPGQVRQRRDELLKIVGLAGRERDPIRKYSKGMLQRLGLAQALLHDPDMLILDEPTDGLDPVARAQMRSVLQTLKREGKTIFLNSHLLQEVELVCDRVAILDKGQLRGIGSVDELAAHTSRELELELELIGDESTIRELISADAIRSFQQAANGNWRLTVFANDQTAVDSLVDRLRQRQISIVAIHRRRVTLEDAFLNLLGNNAESTS